MENTNNLEIPTTPIPNFSNYTIDEDGNVYNKKFKRFLKPFLTISGTKTVRLNNDDKVQKTFSVYKLLDIIFSKLEIPTIPIPNTPIPNFSNYTIDEYGNIYNKKFKRFMKPYITRTGYKRVDIINDDKKSKCLLVHRLVALTLIPNLENKPFIDHIDRNKLNNNVNNLRWVTSGENNANIGISKNNKSGYKNITVKKNGDFIISIIRNENILSRKQFSNNKYTLDEVVKIRNEKYSEFNIEITD